MQSRALCRLPSVGFPPGVPPCAPLRCQLAAGRAAADDRTPTQKLLRVQHGFSPSLYPLPLQDDVPADDFWKEISILRTCRHNNIVQFQVGAGGAVRTGRLTGGSGHGGSGGGGSSGR